MRLQEYEYFFSLGIVNIRDTDKIIHLHFRRLNTLFKARRKLVAKGYTILSVESTQRYNRNGKRTYVIRLRPLDYIHPATVSSDNIWARPKGVWPETAASDRWE